MARSATRLKNLEEMLKIASDKAPYMEFVDREIWKRCSKLRLGCVGFTNGSKMDLDFGVGFYVVKINITKMR